MANNYLSLAKENRGKVLLLFLLFFLALFEFKSSGFTTFAIICLSPIAVLAVYVIFRWRMAAFWALIILNYLIPFKNINFHSSLTGKDYYSKTNEDGTLGIYEKDTDNEVPNNSNPSKRQILYSALEDLGGDVSSGNTLYQLEHKLEKILVSRK